MRHQRSPIRTRKYKFVAEFDLEGHEILNVINPSLSGAFISFDGKNPTFFLEPGSYLFYSPLEQINYHRWCEKTKVYIKFKDFPGSNNVIGINFLKKP